MAEKSSGSLEQVRGEKGETPGRKILERIQKVNESGSKKHISYAF